MHNVLNQPQYYNALKGRGQNEETGFSFSGVIKAFQPRVVPDEPENETDVEDCIKSVLLSLLLYIFSTFTGDWRGMILRWKKSTLTT